MGTRMLDLGTLDGPLLIFGGPYSNLAASQALRDRAQALGIPPQRVICSGDLVAYCAEPEETLALIRDWGISVVMGNCEESLASGSGDCGCGFEAGSACDALSDGWYRYASARVSAASRAWMASLPRRIDFRLNGQAFAVIHGGVTRINRFIFASAAASIFQAELDQSGVDVVIGGHCGIPFGRKFAERAWLNAGVIGMPANDGTRDGWYLLLKPRGEHICCRWRTLSYDAEATAGRMREAGLQDGYAQTLLTGLWPSLDVLPPSERCRQGVPLTLPDLMLGSRG